jgi:hypothetical protein
LDISAQHGVYNLENHDGVVAVFFEDFQSLTFQVGAEISQDWRAYRSFGIWLAVQRSVGFRCRREKFLRDVLLAVVQHVQHGGAAFDDALKRAAILSQCGHQQWGFEGRLRYPGDGGGSKSFGAAGCKDIHAVGQEPQDFLLNFGIHKGERILLQWPNQKRLYLARRLFSRGAVARGRFSEIMAEKQEDLREQPSRLDRFSTRLNFSSGYCARIFLISPAWL